MRIDEKFLARARARLVEMHYRSRVGHLGGNLSAIDAMLLVHHEFMTPTDRFVLSKGHSAGALYVVLWSLGKLADEDLVTFHKDHTCLAGHPPSHGIPGIEFATGSLGHGLSLAAGLALAARLKQERRRIFCLTSDGEWQEGSTIEGLVFAAHHELSNLTIMIDQNGLQGFGRTEEVASMGNLAERLAGFAVELRRCDGHDLDALRLALAPANGDRPVVAVLDTRKGHGVPDFEGTMESHYLPLTERQYRLAVAALKSSL